MQAWPSLIPFALFFSQDEVMKISRYVWVSKLLVFISYLYAKALNLNCSILVKVFLFLCSKDDQDIQQDIWPAQHPFLAQKMMG